mmetsp:Transcript_26088/g.59101  ORF Transcript_26088/g.59101 Transcript_26088/m.59101 type:complete len:332 (-) Transcript_26088:240-1235(-)
MSMIVFSNKRISLSYNLFFSVGIIAFFAGVNLCLLFLLAIGRLNCDMNDPGMHAISAMPHVWCPAHGDARGSGLHRVLSEFPPGQLVIDVGAYDGKEAIEYASAGHNVLSFEPTPSKSENIRRKIRSADLEDKITFYPWAVSDKSGEAPFIVNVGVHLENGKWAINEGEEKNPETMGSEQDGFRVPWSHENSTTVNVKVEKLDNVVPRDKFVLFMKVDSQGHDFKVLKGADRLLSEQRVAVFSAEISPGLMEGGAKEGLDMLNYIASKGYRCYGCHTSFETGFRFGLPVPFAMWTKHLATLKFEHRGANHGQWDDIVCVSKKASEVFSGRM